MEQQPEKLRAVVANAFALLRRDQSSNRGAFTHRHSSCLSSRTASVWGAVIQGPIGKAR